MCTDIALYKNNPYTNVLLNKPKSYTLYSHIKFPTLSILPYRIHNLLGRGASSEVYRAEDLKTGIMYAAKIIRESNIEICNPKKEVLILKNLANRLYVVQLYDFFYYKKDLYLIFELLRPFLPRVENLFLPRVENSPKMGLVPRVNVTIIMYQLLKAIKHCHSNGIIHCDIKPGNMAFSGIVPLFSGIGPLESDDSRIRSLDPAKDVTSTENKEFSGHFSIKLLDFGHAQFYWPGTSYSPKLGTSIYRAPELLFESTRFNYAVDMWSAGCIFSQLLNRDTKIESVASNEEQIMKLNRDFGSSAIKAFCDKYDLICYKLPSTDAAMNPSFLPRSIDKNATDLLTKMLQLDPEYRITCDEALDHPYFK